MPPSTKTKLFVVGDSISVGFGAALRNHAQGFTYSRKNEEGAPDDTSITGQNGGDSSEEEQQVDLT